MLKESVKSIIDIDNRTKALEDQTKMKIESLREDFRNKISELESISTEQSKKIAQEEFDRIIADFSLKVEEKEKNNKEKLQKIDGQYQNLKEQLIEKSFADIILSLDGE